MAFDVHFLRGTGALCGAENGLASPNGDDVNCATCAELLRPTAAHADAFPSADAPHPKIAARYYPRPPLAVSLTRRRWA